MPDLRDVATRMEEIRQAFLQARSVAASSENLEGLLEIISKTNAEYRPVAYEGAAMELALKDFSTDSKLSLWNSFLIKSEPYLISHAHIGLGWAVAHQEISPSRVLQNMRSMMKFYFFDGWGYYDGMFKQRHSIRNKKIPETLDEKHLHAYDQGIGRSIWYLCLGKSEKVKEMISSFAVERQKDLWRGIGIGCSFVGGSDEITLQTMLQHADGFKGQLAAGVALVVRTRFMSGYIPAELELVCRTWCNKTPADVASVVSTTESAILFDEVPHMILISQLESKL